MCGCAEEEEEDGRERARDVSGAVEAGERKISSLLSVFSAEKEMISDGTDHGIQ